jgi:hypothetical protein
LGNNDPLKRLDDRLDRDVYNRLPNRSKQKLGGPDALGRSGQPLRGGASAPAIRSARRSSNVEPEVKPQGKTTKVPGSDVRGPQGPTPTASTPPKPTPSTPSVTSRTQAAGKNAPGQGITMPNSAKRGTNLPSQGANALSTPRSTESSGFKPNSRTIAQGKNGPGQAITMPNSAKRGTNLPSQGANALSTPRSTSAFKPKTIDVASSTSASASGAPKPSPAPSSGPGPGGGPKPPSGPKPPVGKPPMVKGLKAPGVRGGGVLAGVIDTAIEKSSGSGWTRSLAKGATTALGTVAGGALGSAAGPVGTFAGGTAGGMAASKAFDTVAGANAVQRKAMATANRQRQAGGAIKGIGGKTTFDTKKNTITSGGKTAQLGKTSVVTGPGGKQEVGNLAYKNGQAVYKRSDTKSLAQTSSNPLERIGRSLFAGAYKKSDAANAAKKLATARQSDATRNKALGVKLKPGG